MRTCKECGKAKELKSFSQTGKNKSNRKHVCNSCVYKKYGSYYRGQIAPHNKAVRRENRQKAIDYLKVHPCVDCGESDIVVLDFDHVRGKKVSSVSALLSKTVKWNVIEAEIDKCEVRCANCHRRKTAKQHGWTKLTGM